MSVDRDHEVEQFFEKLRVFIAALEPHERELMAALLAPGVAQAYEAEVEGFAKASVPPDRLTEELARVLRRRRFRIVEG